MNDFHIKLSFRKKLLLSFIVLSFIPVLLIGISDRYHYLQALQPFYY